MTRRPLSVAEMFARDNDAQLPRRERRAFLASEIAALESIARMLDADATAARRRYLDGTRDGWDHRPDLDRAERLTAEATTLRAIARRGEP